MQTWDCKINPAISDFVSVSINSFASLPNSILVIRIQQKLPHDQEPSEGDSL